MMGVEIHEPQLRLVGYAHACMFALRAAQQTCRVCASATGAMLSPSRNNGCHQHGASRVIGPCMMAAFTHFMVTLGAPLLFWAKWELQSYTRGVLWLCRPLLRPHQSSRSRVLFTPRFLPPQHWHIRDLLHDAFCFTTSSTSSCNIMTTSICSWICGWANKISSCCVPPTPTSGSVMGPHDARNDCEERAQAPCKRHDKLQFPSVEDVADQPFSWVGQRKDRPTHSYVHPCCRLRGSGRKSVRYTTRTW